MMAARRRFGLRVWIPGPETIRSPRAYLLVSEGVPFCAPARCGFRQIPLVETDVETPYSLD
jgi:hypothetical protein